MPLKFALYDNPMTPDPNDRLAITQVNRAFTLEDVISEMISRGSTVTRAEALSVFEELSLAIEKLLADGNSIITPLFRISAGVSGVFLSDDDGFDYTRHQVKLHINTGLRLRQMERNIPVEKVAPQRAQPVLQHFIDNVSESQDDILTPGSGARIVGSLLKYEETDPQQGVFFINVGSGAVKKVTGKLLKNKPGELIFIVPPDLLVGAYKLEIRALVKGSKNLRTGSLPYELVVS